MQESPTGNIFTSKNHVKNAVQWIAPHKIKRHAGNYSHLTARLKMTTTPADEERTMEIITEVLTKAYSMMKMCKPDLSIESFFDNLKTPIPDAELDAITEGCSIELVERMEAIGYD
ncbi:MAG: hypothetical protein ACJAS1_005772 [Oleiphilaceae bacterium]|jgi:hypothetical protein